MRHLAALAMAVACVAPAAAVSGTSVLTVTGSVRADCVLATHGAMDFGVYDTAQRSHGEPLDVTSTVVSVACTRGASAVTIALGHGENPGAAHRGMSGGVATVAYDIYTTPQRSTVWDTVNTVAYTAANSRPVTIPLYGRIPAGQTVAPGRYSDVLLAMVNF